jgi:hypothetical protein
MRRRQRVARLPLAALTLLALEGTAAQSPRRTTVGRLLAGRVDTIAVEERDGGELGSKSASLQLVLVDSGYRGTLRLRAVVTDMTNVAGGRRCDTTMMVTMPASAAKRLFALLNPAVIEPGEAAPGVPIYDVWQEYSYTLGSRSDTIVVRNGRTLVHREIRYRAPLKRDRKGRVRPPWPIVDMNTPLMKAHEILQGYLQRDRLIALARACRGG